MTGLAATAARVKARARLNWELLNKAAAKRVDPEKPESRRIVYGVAAAATFVVLGWCILNGKIYGRWQVAHRATDSYSFWFPCIIGAGLDAVSLYKAITGAGVEDVRPDDH